MSVEGCAALSGMHTIRHHLSKCHKLQVSDLDEAQKARLHHERTKCYEHGKKVESKYFPLSNVCKILTKPKPQRPNEICKRCNERISSAPGQRDHIAGHMKMTMKCPLANCTHRCSYSKIYKHLIYFHKKVVGSLGLRTYRRLLKSQEEYRTAVNRVKSQYF